MSLTHTTVTREHVGAAWRCTHDVRLRERYHGIVLLMDGKRGPAVAQWLSRDEDTIRTWGQAFNEAGLPGVERAPIPGRPTGLTAEPRLQVTEAVRRGPRASGDPMPLWTTTLIRHFSARRVGIESCRERVRQVRQALGGRVRRRRHRHLTATAAEQGAVVPAVEARLAAWPEDWELRCVEAATVRRHPTLTAPWCGVDEGLEGPTGEDPTQVHVDGAVAPLPRRPHSHVRATRGQEACAAFLRQLLASHPGQRRLVIHDRGAQHTGAAVKDVSHAANGRLRLKAQPAYAPALNPQERIWRRWRRVVTHPHWCATLRAPIEAIRHFFRSLAGGKDQVRRLGGFNPPGSFVASL